MDMLEQPGSPPTLAERLAGRALDETERSGRLGDLEERFRFIARVRGGKRARAWYRRQVLWLVLCAVLNHCQWSFILLKSNLKIAWRNVKRRKAYSSLNIFGLAAGMTVFILIMLSIRFELGFDRYHENAPNIFRVLYENPEQKYFQSNVFFATPGPLAAAITRGLPEVQTAARIRSFGDVVLSRGNQRFIEKNFFAADPQAFSIFSFPLVRGKKDAVFLNPYSILLSQRAARRYFGDEDPIGQMMTLRNGDRVHDFKIEGIFRDIPPNSHFIMDAVVPLETMAGILNLNLTDWRDTNYKTYLLLKNGAHPAKIERMLSLFVERHMVKETVASRGQKPRLLLQNISRIHLDSRANFDFSAPADLRFILLFASIACLSLVIACVNYINLATAQSLKRAKEVGLRKVIGAAKGQIVRQFVGDSMVMTFLALALAIGFVLIVLPAFKAFLGQELVFDPIHDPELVLGLALLAAAVGLAAGSYPAFFVSAVTPVFALKGRGSSRSKGRGLRNFLIVFQFAASISLIICTVGVERQLRYIRNRDMGYDREQIVVVSPQGGFRKKIDSFKRDLMRNPAVLGVAASSELPNNIFSAGIKNEKQVFTLSTDYDFVDLFGLKIVQGRSFSPAFGSDAGGACLISESARAMLGWRDPLGRPLLVYGHDDSPRPIVGVIKDFHFQSLHLPMMPLIIALDPGVSNKVSIKIRESNIPQTLAFIRDAWERFSPEYPFEYAFFDDLFDRAYRTELRTGAVFGVFAALAILMACLGLFGLAAFAAEQKTREIGIRKILGASTPGIIALLSRDFLKGVVLANLVAWPVGYLAISSWLRNFAYRTRLTLPMFLGSTLAVLVIAAGVLLLQMRRAAAANPIDSLRHE